MLHGMWDLPGPGLKPVSPGLAGGFLTIASPGKSQNVSLFYFLKFIYLINLFLSALGLRCCSRAFSSCGEWGLLFVVVRGLLIVVASLGAKRRLYSVVVACGLSSCGSRALEGRLSSCGTQA